MNCYCSSTADIPVRYCDRCGQLGEHGTGGCPLDESVVDEMADRMKGKTFRVMDDRLFIVDPGSPPPIERCKECGQAKP